MYTDVENISIIKKNFNIYIFERKQNKKAETNRKQVENMIDKIIK